MDKHQRGLKRKRAESESEKPEGDELRISGKLHHGLKEIRKAAKKAKVFESQKVVKKLKSLRKNEQHNPDIVEYETQFDVLKGTGHELVANSAARSKIMKDRVLSQYKQVREALSREIGDSLLPTPVQNTPAAKVHSRLLSSKILATAISSVVEDLRRLFDPESNTHAEHEDDKIPIGIPRSEPLRGPGSPSHVGSRSREDGGTVDETGWESGTVEAGEDVDVNGWESGSISQGSGNQALFDGDGEEEESGQSEAFTRRAISTTETRPKKTASVTSKFLPSLSVGFVRGSDESDWSDNEAKAADPGKKKNRRGQRARQAIWEKKYGKNANHKKREINAQNNPSRKVFGASKRGESHRGPTVNHTKKSNTNDPGNHEQRAFLPHRPQQGNLPVLDGRPLHPSWEAKRRLKEQQSVGILPSQGSKIKFSD